ncbi:MAG: outer membrane protein assembly factor BamA [Candidatus Rokuibacteriota bacterium]|nr:MAG: outer membrane protein assembly factor BamA [Candidatus Rokubacteria bacterium]
MTRGGGLRLAVAVFTAVLGLAAAVAAQQPPVLIKELTVEGNRRVQEAVILGRVKSAIGAIFNPAQLSEDVRAVFALGFFDDVQLKIEDFEGGVKVGFVVVERPFVRDVDFVGNKHVSTNELQDKIDLKLGSVYNPVDVQRARERMKEHYESEGYFEVQITPDIEKFADGDVKVVFTINEGRQMKIEEIVIRGNRGLTDKQIKNAMATQERQYWILRGTVQRQRLDEDVDRILQLYNDHGYIQARVESHDVTVDREKARVTINIVVVEGSQHHVASVGFTGVTLVPESEVRRQVKLKAGDVFSRSALRDSVKSIEDLYSNIGRASAEVNPKLDVQPESKIAILFEVSEGPTVYVERINIAGNVRSQDKILRRELQMAEGEIFTLRKLQRSKQRLTNLGYFEKVEVNTAPGSDKTKIVVNIDVTERPTGLFSIGGGFSSADGILGTIDLSQNNFLGRGWLATIKIRAGANIQQGQLSFTEPWLFDRPLAAGFDLFSTQRQFLEYDYRTLGGGLRLSHPFEEFWRWHLGYRLTQDDILHVKNPQDSFLRDEEGTHITSLVSGTVGRDSRDSIQTPSKGGQLAWSTELAGLGGDHHYSKTTLFMTYFQPVWFGHIMSGRAEGGYGFGFGDERLPVFERFFLGGPNSIRSFKTRQISPTDEFGTRIGGTSEVLGNIEYLIPLPFDIRLAAFFDIGNVYGFKTKFDLTELRKAAGGGIRWVSPFGAIRVDYGFNLDRRPGEKAANFHFSVGSPF